VGVDISVLNFLLKFRRQIKGKTLQLGRQGWHISSDPNTSNYQNAQAVLRRYDDVTRIETLAGEGGFTETLFRYLGSDSVMAMDASPYEGADIVHDLNDPVPPDLVGQFDTIFDGGTIEHVFNPVAAFQNAQQMLRVGGLLISVNAANNQLGHGFYQFSPEFMWRMFSADAGFDVHLMQLTLVSETPEPMDAPDPEKVGHRIEMGFTPGATYIMMGATKVAGF
jgi:hypothetical protein